MGSNIFSQLSETQSESLKVEHISIEEFKKMLKTYQNHLKTSESFEGTFINRAYVEKSEMKRVDELFQN